MTPRELYELADRLGHYRYELAQDAPAIDLVELRADLQRASRCVRDLNRLVRNVGDIVAVAL